MHSGLNPLISGAFIASDPTGLRRFVPIMVGLNPLISGAFIASREHGTMLGRTDLIEFRLNPLISGAFIARAIVFRLLVGILLGLIDDVDCNEVLITKMAFIKSIRQFQGL